MSDSGVNDKSVSNESEGRLPKPSPGTRLAALREERDWTVEQVASQLNLAPRQILAIERDDYPALPGMAIVRGFVRAYAKLLKVDATSLLADLGGETVLAHDSLPSQKSLSAPFSDTRMPSMAERPGLSSKWVVGSLLSVLLAVGIWAIRQGGEQAAVPVSPVLKDTPGNIAGTDAVKQPPEVKPEFSASVPSVPESDSPISTVPESTVSEQAVTATPSPAVAQLPAPAPAQSATPAVPAVVGKDTLQLAVREESWIEIRRSGDNSIVLSHIAKPGETESVQITEPVSVVIGNAAGVTMTLRGVPVELKPSSKSNVARLTLK